MQEEQDIKYAHDLAAGDDVVDSSLNRILELEPWRAGSSGRPSICIPSVRIRTGKTSNGLSVGGVGRVVACSERRVSPIIGKAVPLLPEANVHLANLQKLFAARAGLNAKTDFQAFKRDKVVVAMIAALNSEKQYQSF
jgi:hypothetical protein